MDQAAAVPSREPSMARAGAAGALWLTGAQVLSKASLLATTIVLARLLTPAEYGQVSLALIVIAYAETLADAGMAQAIVHFGKDRPVVRAAARLTRITGLVLFAGCLAGALAISWLQTSNDLAILVAVLSLCVVATAAASVPEAILRQRLRFRDVTVAQVARSLVMATVTISLAFSGFGALSLAAGTVAGAVSYAVTCQLLCWRDRDVWRGGHDGEARRKAWRFGSRIAAANLLSRLIFDIDYVIIAAIAGTAALGHYTMAFRIPDAAIISVIFVLASVLYPLFAQVSDSAERFARGYLKSLTVMTLVAIPAGVGLAIIARPVVAVLFGPAWEPAVVPLVFLSLYAAARSLGTGAHEAYKALGKPHISLWISLARFTILLPALFAAAHISIVAVAATQFALALVFSLVMQAVAARVLNLSGQQIAASVFPGCAAAVVVAVVAGTIIATVGPRELSIALAVVGAAAAATLTIKWVWPELWGDLLKLVQRG